MPMVRKPRVRRWGGASPHPEGSERFDSYPPYNVKASRGFESRSLDSESRVLTVTPRGHMLKSRKDMGHNTSLIARAAQAVTGSGQRLYIEPRSMDYAWIMYGFYMSLQGLCLDYVCILYRFWMISQRLCLDYEWILLRFCMISQRLCMDYVRNMRGLCWFAQILFNTNPRINGVK